MNTPLNFFTSIRKHPVYFWWINELSEYFSGIVWMSNKKIRNQLIFHENNTFKVRSWNLFISCQPSPFLIVITDKYQCRYICKIRKLWDNYKLYLFIEIFGSSIYNNFFWNLMKSYEKTLYNIKSIIVFSKQWSKSNTLNL